MHYIMKTDIGMPQKYENWRKENKSFICYNNIVIHGFLRKVATGIYIEKRNCKWQIIRSQSFPLMKTALTNTNFGI